MKLFSQSSDHDFRTSSQYEEYEEFILSSFSWTLTRIDSLISNQKDREQIFKRLITSLCSQKSQDFEMVVKSGLQQIDIQSFTDPSTWIIIANT